MAFDQKPNTGALFKNKDRKTEKHPLYTGTALIDGVEYWVSSWVNEIRSGDRAGEKYMSLNFKPKEQQSQGGGSSQQSTGGEPF